MGQRHDQSRSQRVNGTMMKVELVDKMGNDISVVNAARVSYSKQSKTFTLKNEMLIKYLAEHEHW